MRIGVPAEIKNSEHRVGLTPAGARILAEKGHSVIVQSNAGERIGYSNEDYKKAGAMIAPDALSVYEGGDLIVKVKEPLPEEYEFIRSEHILYCYLHLAANQELTQALLDAKCCSIAYETITDESGGLPLLAPMSEIAGKIATQKGAQCLESIAGGSGTLLGGVPGVAPANVTVIGGGVAGLSAARVAAGMGANVSIVDTSIKRLRDLDQGFSGLLNTVFSSPENVAHQLSQADLVIGAVLIPGAKAPKVVSRAMLQHMKPRSVIVDIAIDQGGCFETSRVTTHEQPTFDVDGILHYCVANIPSCVARTATLALTNATLPHLISIAENGLEHALTRDNHLASGLNTQSGELVCEAVRQSQ